MEDPAAGAPPSDNGAAIVSEQLTALLLKDDDTRVATTAVYQSPETSAIPPSPPSSLEESSHLQALPNRRPLFSSMREALESSGQVKEEPGGYVIKRHSGRQQQHFRSADNTGRPKYRHTKQRANSKGENASPSPVEEEADAAGYTVIRRRSSCDETATSHSQSTTKRNPQSSTQSRGYKKQPQRPRRGSMSALQQSNSLVASISPAPSSSMPPGFQPRPAASRVTLRPPPGLTSAASGWVAKAAVPAEHTSKIEEPPVEALWPEVKTTVKTDSSWPVATTAAVTTEGGFGAQAWSTAANGSASSSAAVMEDDHKDAVDDDDLLARLGVTL